MEELLTFGRGNAKLDTSIATFSLPAAYSCPGAMDCMSMANRKTGNIKDGPHTKFRCFAASAESQYPAVRESRWQNFDLLKKAKTTYQMAMLIMKSLPDGLPIVRVHVSGDFFSLDYFRAWLMVADNIPSKTFYAYTKSLPFVVRHLDCMPSNLKLVASRGGKFDHLIDDFGLVNVSVVYSEAEAKEKGLPIDHDDSHAIRADKNFCLLLHGTQPAGSESSKALSALRVGGWSGYNVKSRTQMNLEGLISAGGINRSLRKVPLTKMLA